MPADQPALVAAEGVPASVKMHERTLRVQQREREAEAEALKAKSVADFVRCSALVMAKDAAIKKLNDEISQLKREVAEYEGIVGERLALGGGATGPSGSAKLASEASRKGAPGEVGRSATIRW